MVSLQFLADAVAQLTFDQPDSKVNVLSRTAWKEFHSTLQSLEARADLRGLILSSAKPGIFIAGADLNELADADPANPGPTREFIAAGNQTLTLLESLPFPTLAILDGLALGGGLEVALACDDRICGTHPRMLMGLPEVNLGLIPGWGGTQRLPRLIDPAWALGRLLSGQNFTPAEVPVGSLVGIVTTSENLLETAVARLATLDWRQLRAAKSRSYDLVCPAGEQPTAAARLMVEVVSTGAKLPLREAIAIETAAFLKLAGGSESRQRIADFFASRRK